ncbi:MAG: Gfo/Idh/MocA family oxidoreductase [Alphaproteobacteria bacterium]|nr:Gfo/Idh/MocA family oxidoreductase [Alphaproteobacteria bacterium]
MTKTMKVCFVGAGNMAVEHAKAFSALKNVEIVGVTGRSEFKADNFANQFRTSSYSTIAEMYETSQADMVVTAVNEVSSRDVSLQCLKYPWTCLFEKPVGQNLKQAEEILSAAEAKKANVFVGLNRRSYNSTRKVLNDLSHDSSPRVINVFDQQNKQVARDIGHPEELVENWMYANSIHLVDYLTLFGRGDITDVELIKPFDRENPTSVVAALKFSSGDLGLYQAAWQGPGPWAVIVSTDLNRYELAPLEKLTIQKLGERVKNEWPYENEGDPVLCIKSGFLNQAMELVRFGQTGRTSLTTLKEATQSMRLVAQLYRV